MSENKACCGNNIPGKIREAICIDTNRVYDSCADKDCLADLRVYFPDEAQNVINNCVNVKLRSAHIINCLIDVEKVPFNKGCYTVDITFFFKVTIEAYTAGCLAPITVHGLTTFSKKCVLYGSDGAVKVYSSEYTADANDDQLISTNTNPRAKVQVAEPIALDAKLCRPCDCCCTFSNSNVTLPKCIKRAFTEEFPEDLFSRHNDKAVAVTLGIFTIVQLERDVQMLIPAYDFCIPRKECNCNTDDPCETFRKIKFPVDEFFPPKNECNNECSCEKKPDCGC